MKKRRDEYDPISTYTKHTRQSYRIPAFSALFMNPTQGLSVGSGGVLYIENYILHIIYIKSTMVLSRCQGVPFDAGIKSFLRLSEFRHAIYMSLPISNNGREYSLF